MKINGSISIFFNTNGLIIKAYDRDAGIEFVEIKLSQEQVCAAFSRFNRTPCEAIELRGFENVGKRIEKKQFEFPISSHLDKWRDLSVVAEIARDICPVGWTPDCYFEPKDSFFEKDGEPWARCYISRWVDK